MLWASTQADVLPFMKLFSGSQMKRELSFQLALVWVTLHHQVRGQGHWWWVPGGCSVTPFTRAPPPRGGGCVLLLTTRCLQLQTHAVYSTWRLDLDSVLEGGSRSTAGRRVAGSGKEGLLLPLCLLWSWQWSSSWFVVLTCPAPAGQHPLLRCVHPAHRAPSPSF